MNIWIVWSPTDLDGAKDLIAVFDQETKANQLSKELNDKLQSEMSVESKKHLRSIGHYYAYDVSKHEVK